MTELQAKISQNQAKLLKEKKANIKAKLARALRHWVLPAPSTIAFYGHKMGGRSMLGPRDVIPSWAQEFVGYQLRWVQYSKTIPEKQRKAAELRLIGDWSLFEISKALNVKVETVDRYVGWALDGVASQIMTSWKTAERCPRCGSKLNISEIIRDTTGEVISVAIKCELGCGRSVSELARELGKEGA